MKFHAAHVDFRGELVGDVRGVMVVDVGDLRALEWDPMGLTTLLRGTAVDGGGQHSDQYASPRNRAQLWRLSGRTLTAVAREISLSQLTRQESRLKHIGSSQMSSNEVCVGGRQARNRRNAISSVVRDPLVGRGAVFFRAHPTEASPKPLA